MNRKRNSSLLFGVLALSLILFGIPSGAFAYHTGSESDLTANPELIAFRNFGVGSVDTLALNPELALFRGYAASGSPVLKVDSGRWSAIGFYHGQYMAMVRGAEADSARWVGKGTFYSGEMARALPPDSIRRSSLGLYYAEKLAKLRSVEADSTRWAAMGDHFLARGRDADSARWAALGDDFAGVMAGIPAFNPELIVVRSYEDLASNPELLSLQKYDTCGC